MLYLNVVGYKDAFDDRMVTHIAVISERSGI